jgi:hypothetical protein
VVVAPVLTLVLAATPLVSSCSSRPRPERERMGDGSGVTAADFPDARAVVLLDRTEITFAQTEKSIIPVAEIVTTRRVQVLSEAGRELARVIVPFDERSRIFSVQGRTMKGGAAGRVVEMNDAAVLDVDRFADGTPASRIYDGPGYKLAKVPDVEVGDVFEIVVLRRVRDPRVLEPAIVGGDLPMLRGEVVVNVQRGLDVDMRVTRAAAVADLKPTRIPTTIALLTEKAPLSEEAQSGTRFAWVFDRAPAVFPEGAAADGRAMATQVHLLLKSGQGAFRSIDDIAAWYREVVGRSDQPDAATKQEAQRIGAARGGKTEKLAVVQRYLQDEIKDVTEFLNLASLPTRTPADVIRYQVGDAKDQASLGLALLRSVGVDGLPVLVSRAGSFASIPDLPTPAPFNHVVIAIPAGGAYAWIDPSTAGLPTGRLPGTLQGGVGILVTPTGGELINLPEDGAADNVIDAKLELTLDAVGRIKGQMRATLIGVPAARAKEIFALPEEKQVAAMRGLLLGDPAGDPEAAPGIGFEDVFRVAGPRARGSDGEESVKVQVRLAPTAFEGTSFRPDDIIGRALGFLWREGRKSPVFLGARSTWKVRVDLKLPEGMGVAELPVSVDKPTPLIHIEENWAIADGVLSFIRTYTWNERVIPPERYDELRAPVSASWTRAKQVVRVVPGGDRGQAYGKDEF